MLIRFTRSAFLRSNLKGRRAKGPNFSLRLFTSEGARKMSEAQFFSVVSTNGVRIKCGAREVGGSISLGYRCEVSERKAMGNLEGEFWVAFEKPSLFQEEFELSCRVWCANVCIIGVEIMYRRRFRLQVVEVAVRREGFDVRRERSPVSVGRSQSKRRFQEMKRRSLTNIFVRTPGDRQSRTRSRDVVRDG